MTINKRIKVMHFVSGFKNGGVEQVLLNYTGLINKNYDIKEIIVYQHKADPEKLSLSKKIGNTMIEIPAKRSGIFRHIYATYKLIKKERPDVVHAHMSLTNFVPLLIAKILKVPVRISHSHIAQDEFRPLLTPVLKKLTIFSATDLMACGEKAGKYMYGNNNFTILYNAINQEDYIFNSEWRREIRQKYNIPSDSFLLGSIGRCVYQKNQKFLVDIFNKFYQSNPNSYLVIIGDGELSKELDNYIAQQESKSNIIRIKGTRSTEKFYSAFDAFLMPSYYEGLPVVAIEAQTSKVTTLLSNTIDPSVKFSNVVKFISISDGPQKWLSKIVREKNRDKLSVKNNYNIKIQYPVLYNYYINALNKKNK